MADAIYTAEATSTGGGRNGHVRSSDGIIDQDVKLPTEMGGPGGATNPEQLFAAGYAACFHGALRLAAKKKGVKLGDTSLDAAVSLTPDDTTFTISVVLTAHLPGPRPVRGRRGHRAGPPALPVLEGHPRQRRRPAEGDGLTFPSTPERQESHFHRDYAQ